MACPRCNCKVTYHYSDSWDGEIEDDYERERCSGCGHIFYLMDAGDDDDEP